VLAPRMTGENGTMLFMALQPLREPDRVASRNLAMGQRAAPRAESQLPPAKPHGISV